MIEYGNGQRLFGMLLANHIVIKVLNNLFPSQCRLFNFPLIKRYCSLTLTVWGSKHQCAGKIATGMKPAYLQCTMPQRENRNLASFDGDNWLKPTPSPVSEKDIEDIGNIETMVKTDKT